MDVGSRVLYRGDYYKIIHVYESGNVEIRSESNRLMVELANKAELMLGNTSYRTSK